MQGEVAGSRYWNFLQSLIEREMLRRVVLFTGRLAEQRLSPHKQTSKLRVALGAGASQRWQGFSHVPGTGMYLQVSAPQDEDAGT